MAETLANAATLAAQPARLAERLAAGDTAGDYVVERFLGAGAMGDVYAGKHPVIGKRVAIKVLRRELAASPEAAERFVREAQAVNQIDHPNVVDIFGFGRLPDGRHYLAMALIDGVSLRARLADPLPAADALDILSAIADALDAAHARGVVHRDLKPDNVMLSSDTPPKVFVLDFGIAKLVSASEGVEGPVTLTGQGAWLGTPGYMAPEQWSADGAGPASDRYALGVIAFELLSGKLPFAAPNLPAMMEQHFRAPVPALSTRGAIAAHATFDPVLQRALAKDPDQRFPTARSLIDALRDALGGKRLARTAPRRSLAMPAAVGAGVLGISVLGVLAVRGMRGGTASGSETVTHEIATEPAGATLLVDGQVVGSTPRTVEAKGGSSTTIELRKPGFLPITRTLEAAGGPVSFTLAPVQGFDGVWQLPDGRLRRFRRDGDRVDVYRRDAIGGADRESHTYDFGPAERGVVFAGSETIQDERSGDPSCAISHRVEYHYEPAPEVLDVRVERVGVGFADGRCVVATREPGAPVALRRVDKGTVSDVRYSEAPIGKPNLDNAKNSVPNDRMDNSLDPPLKSDALKQNQLKNRVPKKAAKQPPPPPPVQSSQNNPPSQIVPQPQPQAPNPEPEPAQQAQQQVNQPVQAPQPQLQKQQIQKK